MGVYKWASIRNSQLRREYRDSIYPHGFDKCLRCGALPKHPCLDMLVQRIKRIRRIKHPHSYRKYLPEFRPEGLMVNERGYRAFDSRSERLM